VLKGGTETWPIPARIEKIKPSVNSHEKEVVRETKELVQKASAHSAKDKGQTNRTSHPETKPRIPLDSHGAA
jgi:hypothetical protein